MSTRATSYARFLQRLRGYERLEPLARSRGPEKLDGVRELAAALEHPERACRVVHVAGTNGKGMTATMIAQLLEHAGLRTGLYTSPHVCDVRERIAVQGAPIGEAAFARAGHAVLDVADALRERIHFSYFDLLTLIALVAFRAERLPWAVLEVGLGGVSDATNIGPKALCVITRIGMDHLHVLGDTLEAIAEQKLGIVTPGTPTVLATQAPELEPWLRARLAERGSRVHDAAEIELAPDAHAPGTLRAHWPQVASLSVPLPGDGAHLSAPLLACATTALVAAEQIAPSRDDAEREARVRIALETRLPGRLELRRNQAVSGQAGAPFETVVLDGGHNAEAVAALHAQLARWGIAEFTLILSLQRDKLVPPLREPLRALLAGARRVITLAPQTVRAPAAAELDAWLAPLLPRPAPPCATARDAAAALALAAETPRRALVVTGSFWMLGDVMRLLGDAAPAADTPRRSAAAGGRTPH